MSKARIIADYAGTGASTDLATQTELDAAETALGFQSVPHIIPGVLYPAVANIMVDGSTALSAVTTGPNSSTVASSKYGTVQSDGRMYYYTDIKGSKPIKDPRIGAHFGSQRHKFRSIQLLEQETATHGANVYSIDGRDWIRCCATDKDFYTYNDTNGNCVSNYGSNTSSFFEITGYFNGINFSGFTHSTRGLEYAVNGGSVSTSNFFTTTVMTPIRDRYVPCGSLVNLTNSLTLGINTIKLIPEGVDNGMWFGAELIAQDTSNVNNIQIPSQNVVSYGKKFTVSGTPHYNPFAFAGDGTTAVAIGDTTSHGKVADGWTGSTATYFDSTLDTATSLGLSAWETGGDFYRPINGGRVVRWVDSSGNIKTSVNMMPPCATAITAGSDASLPTSHAWTTVYQPKIKSGAIDHSLSEVAKTFHWREFGNGSANGNANFKDFSTLNTGSSFNSNTHNAYVMDDGLTGLSADDATASNASNYDLYPENTNNVFFLTFIGTGLSYYDENDEVYDSFIQNLPYGTHIFRFKRDGTLEDSPFHIDGIQIKTEWTRFKEFTFFQPKKPPIPEDAVVLADYMLMADFVKQTTADDTYISKGVRYCNGSRDHYYGGATAGASNVSNVASSGHFAGLNGGSTPSSTNPGIWKLPFFGTTALSLMQESTAAHSITLGGSATTETALNNATTNMGDMMSIAETVTLGQTNIESTVVTGNYFFNGHFVVSPIHTSSHYQTFETPFLHELVGGDRNMEQNNLVVTPDGKTWDEVTRDTSYLGNTVVCTTTDTSYSVSHSTGIILDEWRGAYNGRAHFNKNFAIAYDRMICLVDGQYSIYAHTVSNEGGYVASIYFNGSAVAQGHGHADNYMPAANMANLSLRRGDYIDIRREWHDAKDTSYVIIERV